MYRISTFFIKGQLRGASADDIIKLYVRELEIQAVSNLDVKGNTIRFTNNTFKLVLKRYANQFGSFSEGVITVTDNGSEYIVELQASRKRILKSAALHAAISMLVISILAGFDPIVPIAGVAVFLVLSTISLISLSIAFPVYFVRLRNNIERELQGFE